MCAGLVPVNQPEVPPTRLAPNSIKGLQAVEGRGLFPAYRAAGAYELAPIRKYRVGLFALPSLSLSFHCNYTVMLDCERETAVLERERLVPKKLTAPA